MANIKFVAGASDSSKRVYAFGNTNLFQGGVEFTIASALVGNYTVDGTQTKNAATRQQVVFQTSLSNDPDGLLPLNRLLRGKRVVYGADGLAKTVRLAPFGDELRSYLIEKLGLDDQDCFNADPQKVADTAKQWFDGKIVQCVDCTGFAKDPNTGRLVPGSPCAQFKIKGATE